MFKKILILFMCAVMAMTVLCGCEDTSRIDKASLAETVTVGMSDGVTTYTFYLLSSDDTPKAIAVPANSFEDACNLAKEKYIPDLSLAKFELFIVEDSVYQKCLKRDVQYMAERYIISPQVNITLCDEGTMEIISKSKDAPIQIENFILLLKKKESFVNINSLSIFNNFKSDSVKEFYVSYVNSGKELTSSTMKISNKK